MKPPRGGRYRYAGLVIESDVPLPDLLPADARPAHTGPAVELRVHACTVLPQVPDLQDIGGGWAVSATAVRFQVPNVGAFLMRSGPGVSRIDVAAEHGLAREHALVQERASDIRLFLLGSAIGACLHQRGMLPLHAAGLETAHGCVAITGDSGAGKSTLAAALRQRGLRSLCDDVLAVDPRTRLAWPGYPHAKLWRDAADALGVSTEGCERVDPVRDKYRVPLAVPAQFRATPQLFTRLYVLSDAEGPVGIEPITGAAALAELTRNTYRPFLIGALGRSVQHFQDIAGLMPPLRVFRLVRPRGFDALPVVVETLLAHIADSDP